MSAYFAPTTGEPPINDLYQDVIKTSKFIAKPNEWFVEGTEVVCDPHGSYTEYKENHKFNMGGSLFSGLTNESFPAYTGSLPREDEETCPFTEFYIYDKNGIEISEMTYSEYHDLILKKIGETIL